MTRPKVRHMAARSVFITGANRGIGFELARQLVERGDHVWGAARQAEPEQLLALQPAGTVTMDLADESSIVAGMSSLAGQTSSLDVVINCAGIDARSTGGEDNARGPFDLNAASFSAVSEVNVAGPMVVTREALPLLRAGTNPFVINISSQLGSMNFAANAGSDTAYCVSKAALNMLTVKTAAALRAENIGAVMVHPGWVSSDMGGSSAPLTPIESAAAMIATFDALTMNDTGRFITWDGRTHEW